MISDPDGDALTVTVADGSAGSTSVSGTVITYQNTQSGSSDSFVYTVDDGNGGTDTGIITVTINQPTVSGCTGNPVNTYDNQGVTLTSADIINPSTQFYWSGNGHIYEIVQNRIPWTDASTFSQAQTLAGVPGHLVTITSPDEQAFIDSIVDEGAYWIGASDANLEGCWEWVSGPENGTLLDSGYTNWLIGDPNGGDTGNYAELLIDDIRGSDWNDTSNLDNDIFIVEYSGN